MTFLMVLSPTFKDLIVKTGNFDFEPSAKTIVPWAYNVRVINRARPHKRIINVSGYSHRRRAASRLVPLISPVLGLGPTSI
jgi:hypothetical protein